MKKLIIATLLAFSFGSCSSQTNNKEEALEQTQVTTIKRVSKTEFAQYIKNNTNFQLVDVRTPDEYNTGKIENAVNIDFMDDNFQVNIQKLDNTKPALIYCQSGGRSAKALKTMEKLGFQFVLELEGGYSS